MRKELFYLSTISTDAPCVAREHSFGLELAEFCTAWNMDEKFTHVDSVVKKKLEGIPRSLLHAPYNELFPCAIDKKARALAAERYRQATDLATRYGSRKVIIHGGYNPRIYFPVWYVKQSVLFWQGFLRDNPGVEIVLENVLEDDPRWLLDIVAGVDDPRLRLCLDIGHVNAYSSVPLTDWLVLWAPYLSHLHIHNNDGSRDAHNALNEGTIPIKELLLQAQHLCPDATYTLELMNDAPSVVWLQENDLI
jgi:sugar phosphate isomerase/epimerase